MDPPLYTGSSCMVQGRVAITVQQVRVTTRVLKQEIVDKPLNFTKEKSQKDQVVTASKSSTTYMIAMSHLKRRALD